MAGRQSLHRRRGPGAVAPTGARPAPLPDARKIQQSVAAQALQIAKFSGVLDSARGLLTDLLTIKTTWTDQPAGKVVGHIDPPGNWNKYLNLVLYLGPLQILAVSLEVR